MLLMIYKSLLQNSLKSISSILRNFLVINLLLKYYAIWKDMKLEFTVKYNLPFSKGNSTPLLI